MTYKELKRQVEAVQSRLTPAFVEGAVNTLLRQGEDVGGGVNAFRLVKHLLGNPPLRDVEVTWAYERLKPALRSAFEQIPSLSDWTALSPCSRMRRTEYTESVLWDGSIGLFLSQSETREISTSQ